MLDNNQIDKIKCAEYQCKMPQIPDFVIKEVLGEDYSKYQRMLNNRTVAQSGGTIIHCPDLVCEGTIYKGKAMNRICIKCPSCHKVFCNYCDKLWHEGPCTQATAEELQWDMLGDSTGKANRCPKCKSPFEKVSGCAHMTCSVCQHHWCWVCGMDFNSPLHMISGSGLICEMIGWISFGNLRGCTKILLLLAFIIFFPLFVLFISLVLGGALATVIIQAIKVVPAI